MGVRILVSRMRQRQCFIVGRCPTPQPRAEALGNPIARGIAGELRSLHNPTHSGQLAWLECNATIDLYRP